MKRSKLFFILGVALVFAMTTTVMAADKIVLRLGHDLEKISSLK